MKHNWIYYAKLARKLAKNIVTGEETMKDGTRIQKAVDIQDINATAALNRQYVQIGSIANIHTWPGGRQEIHTMHTDGSEGLFITNRKLQGTSNAMDSEVEKYMRGNLDESIHKKSKIRLTESKLHSLIKRAVVKVLNEVKAPKYWQPDEFVDWDEWIADSNYGYDFFEKNEEKSDKLGIPLDQRCHLCNKALKGDKYKPVKFSTASGSSHWCYNPNGEGEDVKIGNTCFKSLQRAHDRKYGK